MIKKKQNSKEFIFSIYDPIFYGNFFFVFSNEDKARKFLWKRFELKDDKVNINISSRSAGATIEITNGDQNVQIIWINEEEKAFDVKNPTVVGTLSHECMHAISMVLNYDGINHTGAVDEVYPYYHTWLFREVMKKLEKRK